MPSPRNATPLLTRQLRPGEDPARELGNAQWLGWALHLVPDHIERPWVWSSPGGGLAMVGWGRARTFSAAGPARTTLAWQAFRRWADAQPVPTLAFGSFPFSPTDPGFLAVPQVVLVREHPGAPTNLTAGQDDWQIAPHDLPRPGETRIELDTAAGAREAWTQAVLASQDRMRSAQDPLEKVVLSRAVEATADRPLDQRRIACWLGSGFPECWTFSHEGLVGATPELLVDVTGGVFRCRILAGTRAHRWEDELLGDPKERHEHELSVTSVTSLLTQAGLDGAEVRGPFLLRLPNVTHLATDVTARVGAPGGSAHIADVLFPTAAVCGTPRATAHEQIRRVEQLDRGRFSGPVGWIAPDGSGQWGLALRCAQFAAGSGRARLYAGAGILADSRPDKEWLETAAKMAPMREALHHG